MPSLRDFLHELDRHGDLLRIRREASVKFEIAAAIKRMDGGPALLFERVKESPMCVVANVVANKLKLFKALNTTPELFYTDVLNALRNPSRPKTVSDGPVREVVEEPKLSRLPILTHYEGDAGPYITAAVVCARSLDGGVENVSVHRLLVLDESHAAIRVVPRHLRRIYELAREAGRPVGVSIAIGVHPAVMLAAATPPPFGVSEYHVANTLLKGELSLIECERVNAPAPADAEIVLEGRILPDRTAPEGPFVDLLGTYDTVREEPVVELLKVYRRRDALYQAILGGGTEHKVLMGIAKEAKIWEAVRGVVPEVKAVNLSSGGCGWLHAIVSIRKQTEGDGKNAIMAALGAHPSLKHVIVVDEDIDAHNLEDVEWALATRFRADRGLVVVSNVRGSSLDPTVDEAGTTSKMGLDATRPLAKSRALFERGKIPNEQESVKRLLG